MARAGCEARTEELLAAISGKRLLCLGDVMLDRFVHGRVERISPEAPIPVLSIAGEWETPGGGANVARNAAALGAHAELVGVVGDDDAGERLTRLLAENGISADLLVQPGERTTVKTRFLSGGHQLLRVDRDSREIDLATAMRLLALAEKSLGDVDAVVLSDYGKGVLSRELLEQVIARARAANRFIAVDPRGSDWSRYRGADLLTPNRRELAIAAGHALADRDAVAPAARRLREVHCLGALLVTLSEQGMLLVTADETMHLPAMAREVADVTGAGDTVIAAVAAAVAADASLHEAAGLANVAAGIVVSKLGTAIAQPGEIAAASDAHIERHKLVSLPHALERIRRWRLQGQRIGFTNGCFDLLHPGHAGLLAFARAACDRLVVGLNDDASVRRLKGPGRPVQGLASRAAVLGAMTGVDLVLTFSEDTPLPLIEAIRPDLLVKGADYTEQQVVGADFVRSYGGKVQLAPLQPGHSTSATVRRIALAAVS
jgi:D-beta-D-heptose 7-phosphate kinase/D-beta-D-heptose 1-phosphate adenosyltransferase